MERRGFISGLCSVLLVFPLINILFGDIYSPLTIMLAGDKWLAWKLKKKCQMPFGTAEQAEYLCWFPGACNECIPCNWLSTIQVDSKNIHFMSLHESPPNLKSLFYQWIPVWLLNWLGKILSSYKPKLTFTAIISNSDLRPIISVLTNMLLFV